MDLHNTVDRQPVTEGRYLVYTQHDTHREFASPKILSWWKGDWHYPETQQRFAPTIYAWSGPLLTGAVTDLFPPTPARAPNPVPTKFGAAVAGKPVYNGSTDLYDRAAEHIRNAVPIEEAERRIGASQSLGAPYGGAPLEYDL